MPTRRFFILTFLIFLAFLKVPSVAAAPFPQDDTPNPTPEGELQLSISDEVCLGCHNQPGQTMTLEDGTEWDLYVPAEFYYNSVHGEMGYACVQCHTQVGEYPHPPFSPQDARDASIKLNETCRRCHATQYNLAQDSVHATAFDAGNRQAAICTDCHTAHEVRRLTDEDTHELTPEARLWIPQTCALCHSQIYEKYKVSVHGSALVGEGNPDVPTCIDCHGVHNIQDPRTTSFRLESPSLCAKCHTDPSVVGKYGLSTNVLETYVADFHGTTQVLFESVSPDAQFNTPVCYDCHGVHDIASSRDPEHGLQIKENLLVRCQECHPDATDNFPAAWMSHYTPSPQVYPVVFYVDLFYKILIPVVLGGMALLVALDFSRAGLNKFKEMNLRWQLTQESEEAQEGTKEAVKEPAPTGELEETVGKEAVEGIDPESKPVEVEQKNGTASTLPTEPEEQPDKPGDTDLENQADTPREDNQTEKDQHE